MQLTYHVKGRERRDDVVPDESATSEREFSNMTISHTNIAQLILPQFSQLGFRLEQSGSGFHGTCTGKVAHGEAWAVPLGDSCLYMEHTVIPLRDMDLLEIAPEPYACITQMNEESLACMKRAGFPGLGVRARGCAWPYHAVCTFYEHEVGTRVSPLVAGRCYRSRSVLFLPAFFGELSRRYPHELDGLPEALEAPLGRKADAALRAAMGRLGSARARTAGGRLWLMGCIEAMLGELAGNLVRDEGQDVSLPDEAGTVVDDPAAALAERAAALVEKMIEEGSPCSLSEVAERLYVSRSHLCAAFRKASGEPLGSYIRARRIEHAKEALLGGEAPSTVAKRLGFPSVSAFSHVFREVVGMSPSAWVEAAEGDEGR